MPDQGAKRILVVDDEEIVRLSCIRTLKPGGYEVEAVDDAYEALSILRERHFDIIVTDFKMPDMDGVEFIDMLRRTSPSSRVLLVTGFATEEVKEQAEAMGASYLAKPFSPSELKEAIEGL